VSQDSRDARKGTAQTTDYLLPERLRSLALCKSWDGYAGTHRDADPKRLDELGAAHVVDCMLSNMDGTRDRIAFFPAGAGTKLYEVRRLQQAPIASTEGLTWRH
jgi:hypothetical protein